MATKGENSNNVELETLQTESAKEFIEIPVELFDLKQSNDAQCFNSQLINGLIKICCANPLVKAILWLVRRFSSLLLALWMVVDMCLDANQTYTFYQHAYDRNGTYNTWALTHMNNTNSTYHHHVSKWYFNIACTIWITPPALLSICLSLVNIFGLDEDEFGYFSPFGASAWVFGKYSSIFKPFPYGKSFNLSLTVLYFPIDIIASAVCIYVLMPLAVLESGLTVAWYGKIKEDKTLAVGYNNELLPGFKMFEVIGEALPQILLALVFAANNYSFLSENDLILGIPVPTTLVSIIFSFGSLVMGFYNGGLNCKKHIWDD